MDGARLTTFYYFRASVSLFVNVYFVRSEQNDAATAITETGPSATTSGAVFSDADIPDAIITYSFREGLRIQIPGVFLQALYL